MVGWGSSTGGKHPSATACCLADRAAGAESENTEAGGAQIPLTLTLSPKGERELVFRFLRHARFGSAAAADARARDLL